MEKHLQKFVLHLAKSLPFIYCYLTIVNSISHSVHCNKMSYPLARDAKVAECYFFFKT